MSPVEILKKERKRLQHKLRTCQEEEAKISVLINGKHISPEAAALFRPGIIVRPEDWKTYKAKEKQYAEWVDEYESAIAAIEALIREYSAQEGYLEVPQKVRWDLSGTNYSP